jgi:uncharacterized lipoprotein YddW (UPF0748 family)
VDSLLARAALAGANGVVVQVVGRAEAYYASEVLPPADFRGTEDPLRYLVARARPMGMEVHAWINAFLVWSAPRPPSDSSHVVLAHPEWLMTDRSGRSTMEYSRAEADRAGLVGATLSPAEPGVRELLGAVAEEVAAGYAVDGIHLDYIRYPGTAFGFEPRARALFSFHSGEDPLGGGYPRGRVSEATAAEWSRWRSEMVTETVETVSAAVRGTDPFIELSAAVIADPWAAEGSYSCPWRDWLEEGLLDLAFPMAYATDPRAASRLARMDTEVEPDRIVYGIACYNQPLANAWDAAELALQRGAAGVCVFSLGAMDDREAALLSRLWGDGRQSETLPPAAFHRVWRRRGLP